MKYIKYIKICFFVTVLSIIVLSYNKASAQTWDWIHYAGSTGSIVGEGITVDASGNIYAIGSYLSSAIFEDETFTGSSYRRFYIVKYDKNGVKVWIKHFIGSHDCYGYNIKTDSQGNIYFVANPTIGTLYLDATVIMYDMFVAKLDPQGDLLWAQPIPATGHKTSLDVDSDGNSYVSFTSNATGNFGSIVLSNTNIVNDIGFGKFDTNGNAIWAKLITGSVGGRHGFGIDINASGALCISGLFGNKSLAAIIDASNGNTIKELATISGTTTATCVLVDDFDNYVVGGMFEGVVNFGSTTLTAMGDNDIFLASYDINGNENWVKQIVGTGINSFNCLISDIVSDESGNYYACGRFSEGGVFEGNTLTSMGSMDAFVAKYDLDGNYFWAEQMGSNGSWDCAYDIEVTKDGMIAITGEFDSYNGIFGDITLPALGSSHAFISTFTDNDVLSVSAFDNSKNDLLLYPNPSKSYVNYHFELLVPELITIKIYNSNGDEFFSEEAYGSNKIVSGRINFEGFSKGIYMLKIVGSKTNLSRKIIIN